MDVEEIRALVAALDTPKALAQEEVMTQLRPLGIKVVPILREFYPKMRTRQGRVALVFHAIPYARTSEEAFRLGMSALKDKSYLVRWRACALLAYSQRTDALPALRSTLDHDDARTREDAQAAIEAIEERNHHLFQDRDRTGSVRWIVSEDDRAV